MPPARTKSHGSSSPLRGPCAIFPTAVAGVYLLVACGSAPDPFTATGGEYDAGAAGTRAAREIRRVDVLGAGGATATATAAGGSETTQGDGGPTASSGGAASAAIGGSNGGIIAAGGAISLDSGRRQGSGGIVASGGAATGTGGWMGCKPFLGCAGSGPVTCDPNKCPGPCPVDQATGLREAFCCTIDAACGCESTDPMWGTRVCK